MSRPRSVTCRQLVELVTSYLEDALDARARETVEDHFAACADCSAYLLQMRHLIVASESLLGCDDTALDLPPGLLGDLLAEFRRRSLST